jgi:von Willebrand factor type A domain
MNAFDELMDDESLEDAPDWYQLAVMVNDGSGSMTWPFAEPDDSLEDYATVRTKAAAVDGALRTLIKDIKKGKSPQNYQFSFVSFNDRITDKQPPRALREIAENDNYDPTSHGTGGTAIHLGLDAAAEIAEAYLAFAHSRELPVSVVVVLMSDGEERDDPMRTTAAAERIRNLSSTILAACLFATKDQPAIGQPLLESIVSEPELFQRVYNAQELRKFFKKSVTATRPRLLPRGS